MSAAFSAAITTTAFVLPPTMRGNTDASDDAQSRYTVHAQGSIDDGIGVRSHAATADRVMNRVCRAAHVASERRVALLSETWLDLDGAVAREGGRRNDPPRQLEPAQRRWQIFGVGEQVGVDGGRDVRIRARERDAAAAPGVEVNHAQREAMAERKGERARVAPRRLKDDLQVRTVAVRRRANEGVGLEHVAGERAATKKRVLEQVPGPARCGTQRDPVGLAVAHLHQDAGGQVVMVVRAHPGQVVPGLDAERAQRFAVADAGEQENLRRLHGPGAHDDLAARLQALQLPGALELDARRAAVLEKDSRHQRVGAHLEIAACACRAQVGHRGRIPSAVADRSLSQPVTFGVRAVEILAAPETERAHRFQERGNHRIGPRDVAHPDWSAPAVPGRVRVRIVALGADEVRQHVAIAPARVAHRGPVVEVPRLAAKVHHAVDRARPADHAPARQRDAPVVECGLRLGHEAPVERRPGNRRGNRRGNMDEGMAIFAARLEETDRVARIFGQSGREHAAGGAGAHDHEVERVGHHTAADTAMSERRCQRSRFTSEFMTPVLRPTKVMSSSGSTQKIVVPAPC